MQRARLRASYDAKRAALARFHVVAHDRARFLAILATSYLEFHWPDQDIRLPGGNQSVRSVLARVTARLRDNPTGSLGCCLENVNPVAADLLRSVQVFGKAAAPAFEVLDAAEQRRIVKSAVLKTFQDRTARGIMTKFYDRFRIYLTLDSDAIGWWVSSGETGGIIRIKPYQPASYAEMDETPAELTFELNHLHATLRNVPIIRFESVIQTEINDAYAAMRRHTSGLAEVGLPALGLAITIRQALVVSGPAILIGFMIFAATALPELHAHTKPAISAFPRFQSPTDPLGLPLPNSAAELAGRLIWLGFLLTPLVILTLGVVTRYDLYSIVNTDRWRTDESWAAFLTDLRSPGRGSLLVDQVTLLCLYTVCLINVELTRPIAIPRRAALVGIGILAAAGAGVWYLAVAASVTTALGTVFAISAVAAGARRARLMFIASIVGLAIITALAVIPARWP